MPLRSESDVQTEAEESERVTLVLGEQAFSQLPATLHLLMGRAVDYSRKFDLKPGRSLRV